MPEDISFIVFCGLKTFTHELIRYRYYNFTCRSRSKTRNNLENLRQHKPDFVKVENELDPLYSQPKTKKRNPTNNKSRRKSENPRTSVQHPPPLLLEDPIQCDDCTVTFNNNVDFAFHSITHSTDKKYTCHLCKYRSSYKYKMGMHVRTHEGTNKFKCEICNKAFMGQKQAQEHKNFHTGEKPFQCEICGRDFMFSTRLAAHRRSYHYEILTGKPLVKFDCVECKKHYKSAEGLRTHIIKIHKAHEIDLTVVCDICGKTLANKKRLKFHLRTHTGYKPYACPVCPKCFSKKDQLVEHIRTHTGEKPHICKLCGKGFAQRTPLKTHQRTHNANKPGSTCTLCGLVFKSKADLENHVKVCFAVQVPFPTYEQLK